MQDLKVSLIQCKQVWEDKKANLDHFEKLLKRVQYGVDIVVFPEMFQSGYTMNVEKMAESINGDSVQWIKDKAKEYNCAITASLIVKENGNYYNRMVFVQADGKIDQYDKRKLFTFSNEEKYYTPGDKKNIIEYKGWKIFLQVCYDLRFPEMSKNEVVKGIYDYDLLINVANWPAKRRLHWKSLLQARAIENQAYYIGVNRVGENNKGLYYSGDSSLIAADGTIMDTVTKEERVINNTLSYQTLKETRKQLPFLKDR